MKSVKPIISILIVALTALLVAACGGGGGDDSSTVTLTSTGVNITPTNAEKITSNVLGSVDTLQGMSTGSDFLTGVSISVPDSNINYPDLVVQLLERLSALASQSNTSSVTGVVVTVTELCLDGGSVTISGDVVDPNVTTVGDTLTATFNNCDELGIVTNGTMSITITDISANFDGIPPYTLGIEVILTSFSMNDGSLLITGNGDMNMLLSDDGAGNQGLVLSGNSFTASAAGEVESLTNYLYDVETNDFSGDYSIDLQGTIESTAIGGSVSYVTLVTFTGNDFIGDGNPTAGVLLVTTSIDNSKARVTAQPDGINLQIEVDADGDGTYETIIMTTWVALEGL